MRAALWLTASLTINACLATLLHAQGVTREQLQAECRGDVLARRQAAELGEALFRRTPDETWRRMQIAAETFDFLALGDSVRALWDTLSTGADADVAARMLALLERQRNELQRLETDTAFRRTEGMTPRWFRITEGTASAPWQINAAEPDSAVALMPGQTTLQAARAVCWTALLARKLADEGSAQARANTRQVLAARGLRWDNFERHGYSLTPLELLINGWCGWCRSFLEPPRVQIIAVHVLPTYAVRDETGSRAALTTEVAGFLVYNKSRSFHLGFSYAYALPSEERRESGWVVHVGRIGQLGLTFRDDTYRRRNASLLLSADLYRFIEAWTGKLRDEHDAITKGFQKLTGAHN